MQHYETLGKQDYLTEYKQQQKKHQICEYRIKQRPPISCYYQMLYLLLLKKYMVTENADKMFNIIFWVESYLIPEKLNDMFRKDEKLSQETISIISDNVTFLSEKFIHNGHLNKFIPLIFKREADVLTPIYDKT